MTLRSVWLYAEEAQSRGFWYRAGIRPGGSACTSVQTHPFEYLIRDMWASSPICRRHGRVARRPLSTVWHPPVAGRQPGV